jgi:DNA-binding XRE family transcriptional regulator
LKAARMILGLTTRQMAEVAKLNRNSILKVEKTKTLPSSAWAADRMATALQNLGVMFTIKDGFAGIAFAASTRRHGIKYVKSSEQKTSGEQIQEHEN